MGDGSVAVFCVAGVTVADSVAAVVGFASVCKAVVSVAVCVTSVGVAVEPQEAKSVAVIRMIVNADIMFHTFMIQPS